MLAIMTGTTVPQKANAFISPLVARKAFPQLTNTNVLAAICSHAALVGLGSHLVKWITTKQVNPVAPDKIIQNAWFKFSP